MNKALRRFGWGLLLVMVDFRLVFVDILPDIIGYALMWSAIAQLGAVHRDYAKALPFIVILTFLSLGEWYPGLVGTDLGELSISLNAMIYGGIMQLLLLLLLHYFLLSLARQAIAAGASELAASANGCRLYYVIVMAVTLIGSPFAIHASTDIVIPAAVIMAILGFIASLLILFLCFRAARELLLSDHN